MHKLVIQHVPQSDPPAFTVARHDPYHMVPEQAVVAPPHGFPVEGMPNSDLRKELRWYLEEFLNYPFAPATDRADRVLAALKAWGNQAFKALFDAGQARDFYHDATSNGGLKHLELVVVAAEPLVLAWPWEAVCDPAHGYLSHQCHIERQLTEAADPQPLPENLPQDRVNILLVTARPFEGDVQYRSISRPLVELIAERHLPAEVTILRPPTLDRLDKILGEQPGYFHLLHFDGHGAYGIIADDADSAGSLGEAGNPHMLQAPQGCLVFETDQGKPHPVRAEVLLPILQRHRLPAVVLNACQSAMADENAEDAFASVAASLVGAGVRSVVAMAYSLYVSGAQEFLPAFYEELFRTGNLAQPTGAGRRAMLKHPGRVCARGRFDLQDWLVPVVYQQQPADFSFAAKPPLKDKQPNEDQDTRLPDEVREKTPYGFIGRDGPILAMERALRRRPPVILIHGLGGVGKTTLARGFVRWLEQTNGLGLGCLWLSFHDIRTAEYVLNRMGEAFFGPQFIPLNTAQKVQVLGQALHDNPLLLVWDNFESASGNEAACIDPKLPSEDRQVLLELLRALDGGQTKVLITSRSEEAWLPAELRCKVELGGLTGEERWEFCTAILTDLGLTVDRSDADLATLMDLLNGHPLLMRAVLPRLEKRKPASVLQEIRQNMAALGSATDATLQFVQQGLPEELRPLLIPLALHERFADADYLEEMAKQVDEPRVTRGQIDRFMAALATAGLIRDRGQAIYELHPALSGYLRTNILDGAGADSRDRWTRAFVDVMGRLADALAPRPLHEKRGYFSLHEANFHAALGHAERLGMDAHFAALTQSLATYALNTRNFDGAERLFTRLAERRGALGDEEGQAAAYHQLGMIAEERRDFDQAEKWYLKAVAVFEKLGIEQHAASTYHQLGRIAEERRDFDQAEKWYLKALAIKERLGNEGGAAGTYHQLGSIAQERREFDEAERWYLKAVAVFEKLGIEEHAASTYHQLGMIAEERRDFDQAEKWYLKSLAIEERLGNEGGAAITYHQLGIIAEERRDFDQAEKWYLKALAIDERLGNEHGAASTYHQLGRIAQGRRDFDQAEKWYLKSLAIKERLGNEGGAANTYHQLGRIAELRRDFDQAEKWYLKSLAIEERLGNEHGAASTYGQLGIVAALRERFEEAGPWLIRCVQTFLRCHDEHGAARDACNFALLCRNAPEDQAARLRQMWQEAGLGPLPDVPSK